MFFTNFVSDFSFNNSPSWIWSKPSVQHVTFKLGFYSNSQSWKPSLAVYENIPRLKGTAWLNWDQQLSYLCLHSHFSPDCLMEMGK